MSTNCPKCLSDEWKSARLVVLEGTTTSKGALSGEIKGVRVSKTRNQDQLLADPWFTYDQSFDADLHSSTVSALVDEVKGLMVEAASAKLMPIAPAEPKLLPPPEKILIEKPKGRGLLSVDPNQSSAPKRPEKPENPLKNMEAFEAKSWFSNFKKRIFSSFIWVVALFVLWNYFLPDQASTHYNKLLMTLEFVNPNNEASSEASAYFTLPNAGILKSISGWVNMMDLNPLELRVLSYFITFLLIFSLRIFILVATTHKVEPKRRKDYDALVQEISEKYNKIKIKYDDQLKLHESKVAERMSKIKSFEHDEGQHTVAMENYRAEVKNAEKQYKLELEQRSQIMSARQAQYLEKLANYDAEVAIVKSFRAELWDRARLCTRCGTPYMATRMMNP